MNTLWLSGLGCARPDTQVREEFFLSSEGAAFARPDQRTALQPDYIIKTRNADPYDAVPALAETPTTLATRAARSALARAGIEAEELGLLIGSTDTPLQTTPFESQRLGKELGVKLPAYDIHVGGADFAVHLETISSWKEERIPRTSVIVSSHIPTSRFSFQERSFATQTFSDGGSAAVVSREPLASAKGSAYRIECAKSRIFVKEAHRLTIPTYGCIEMDPEVEESIFVPALQELLAELRPKLSAKAYILESQLSPPAHDALRAKGGGDRLRSTYQHHGNMLGATPIAALEQFEREPEFSEVEQIVVLQSGAGLSVGAVVLSREG
jgi:3-oxoacyl-[acyl-carrier-protein] synthase III